MATNIPQERCFMFAASPSACQAVVCPPLPFAMSCDCLSRQRVRTLWRFEYLSTCTEAFCTPHPQPLRLFLQKNVHHQIGSWLHCLTHLPWLYITLSLTRQSLHGGRCCSPGSNSVTNIVTNNTLDLMRLHSCCREGAVMLTGPCIQEHVRLGMRCVLGRFV